MWKYCYIWKHKLVRCADEYHEVKVQAASSAALSLMSLLQSECSLHQLELFLCYFLL